MSSFDDVNQLYKQTPGIITIYSGDASSYAEVIEKAERKVYTLLMSTVEAKHKFVDQIKEVQQRKIAEEKEKKDLEVGLSSAKAKIIASDDRIRDIKIKKVNPLQRELEVNFEAGERLQGIKTTFSKIKNTFMIRRFFGEEGPGGHREMRATFRVHTVGDLAVFSYDEKLGMLSYAAFLGAETKQRWRDFWVNPPFGVTREEWKAKAGQKQGVILFDNGLEGSTVDFILTHLCQLQPSERPTPKFLQKRKRRISEDGGRSSKKSRRSRMMERQAKAEFEFKMAMIMAKYGWDSSSDEDSDSASESEEET